MVERLNGTDAAPRRAGAGADARARAARSSRTCARSRTARALRDRRGLRRRRHGQAGARSPRAPTSSSPRRGGSRGPDRPPRALPRQRVRCSCSTRPTGCSTWAFAQRSTGSSALPRGTARRCSSRRRSTARSAASRDAYTATRAATSTRECGAGPPRRRSSTASCRSPTSSKVAAAGVRVEDPERGLTLVFVRTKRGADRLVKRLAAGDVQAVAIHGDKSQGQRERALARFESGDVDTLVATDVAARGHRRRGHHPRDQLRLPASREDYVHRIGRTARAGAAARASPSWATTRRANWRAWSATWACTASSSWGGCRATPPGSGEAPLRSAPGALPRAIAAAAAPAEAPRAPALVRAGGVRRSPVFGRSR